MNPSSLESLKQWFLANNRPFFTLYFGNMSGGASQSRMFYRNETIEDLEGAWEEMQRQILIQAEQSIHRLITIYVTDKRNHNYGMYMPFNLPSAIPMQNGIAGIGSLSGSALGAIQTKAELDAYVNEQRERWELEARIAALESEQASGASFWEKMVDRVSESPQLAGIAQLLIARLLPAQPAAMPQMQYAPVNGTPESSSDDVEDDQFEQDLAAVTEMLNTDEATLMAKLRELVEKNPAMAQTLLQ